MGRRQVLCHGDDTRFERVASLIAERFPGARHVVDVAGGQGLLSRLLTKRHGFEAEVVDPRGNVLKGVAHQARPFSPSDADFYDLVVGLHPDGALRAVVESALVRPTLLVPCCNFWSDRAPPVAAVAVERRAAGRRPVVGMGLKDMIASIQRWYDEHHVGHEVVDLGFSGPYRIGFVTGPPR